MDEGSPSDADPKSESARVLARGGHLVLVDLFSALLAPTLIDGRRDKAPRDTALSGCYRRPALPAPTWHGLYTPIINAVVAVAG
jgi:hypothetical protein